MLTALRKFFGLVALLWLGWLALTFVVIGATTAIDVVESPSGSIAANTTRRSTEVQRRGPRKSRSIPAGNTPTYDSKALAALMLLVSYMSATPGILSCIVWFGIRTAQAPKERRGKKEILRRNHRRVSNYLDYAKWFKLKNGQAVFAHGKHTGRPLREVAKGDPEYLRWMLTEDIPDDTREIVEDLLQREPGPSGRQVLAGTANGSGTAEVAAELSATPKPRDVFTYEAPGQPMCPQCDLRPGLFYCRTHRALLCLTCMGSHDVPEDCTYVPGWRAEGPLHRQPPSSSSVYSYEAPGLPRCPQCELRPALIYCNRHRVSLCLNCLGSHDAPSECAYVPGWRAGKSDAKEASDSGLGGGQPKQKTGDVFGIS